MRIIHSDIIEKKCSKLVMDANYHLPCDVKETIENAFEKERNTLAKDVLSDIIKNYNEADKNNVPICQDTGMAVFFIEIGSDCHIIGKNIEEAVNNGVKKGYNEGYLRKSVVKDPLDRVNTKDNTPAIIHYSIVNGDRIKINFAPKGFGSENMSALKMLKPSDGVDGIIEFVVNTVKEASSNPCPPILLGIGIGGTMEKAALLSKKALLRDMKLWNEDDYYENLEKRILKEVNKLDIGPQGFGGDTTCLKVNIETYPTHIAGLPVAVNINCHVARHKTIVI